MSRPAPGVQPRLGKAKTEHAPFVSIEIDVVTPILGGGATPGKVDLEVPVRGPAIRGSLRFWWRACHAPRYASPAALLAAESELWGAQSRPSAINLEVQILERGVPRPFAHFDRRNSPLPYVLFPFRARSSRAVAVEGARFRLDLALASHVSTEHAAAYRSEAEGALWAWLTFGGVGARTRRGCGALAAPPDMRPAQAQDDWLAEAARTHTTASTSNKPVLPILDGARCIVFGGEPTSPWTAWESAVELLKGFRRQQGVWPEAATIRRALLRNEVPVGQEMFPRADLGLPIVFQRLLSPDPALLADSPGGARMASPVIVRPLVLSSGKAVPLIVVLNAPHLSEAGARLQWSSRDIPLSRTQLGSSIRDDFINYVRRRSDWTEVRLQGGRPTVG